MWEAVGEDPDYRGESDTPHPGLVVNRDNVPKWGRLPAGNPADSGSGSGRFSPEQPIIVSCSHAPTLDPLSLFTSLPNLFVVPS